MKNSGFDKNVFDDETKNWLKNIFPGHPVPVDVAVSGLQDIIISVMRESNYFYVGEIQKPNTNKILVEHLDKMQDVVDLLERPDGIQEESLCYLLAKDPLYSPN